MVHQGRLSLQRDWNLPETSSHRQTKLHGLRGSCHAHLSRPQAKKLLFHLGRNGPLQDRHPAESAGQRGDMPIVAPL